MFYIKKTNNVCVSQGDSFQRSKVLLPVADNVNTVTQSIGNEEEIFNLLEKTVKEIVLKVNENNTFTKKFRTLALLCHHVYTEVCYTVLNI